MGNDPGDAVCPKLHSAVHQFTCLIVNPNGFHELSLVAAPLAPVYLERKIMIFIWVAVNHVFYYCIFRMAVLQGLQMILGPFPPGSVGFPPVNSPPALVLTQVAFDAISHVSLSA